MDVLAQLNASLASRYLLDREIGRGGMATVYLARDVKHNRRVAVKVLNPELGAVLGVERFLSEIRVTANLQHPNLLPLFDSGEAEGFLFYVMPYVEGESLRGKLHNEKQLPIDEALHIATAVAAALDYAHRHGVVHRDLKPENILLHEGEPVVADFGIALAVRNAGGERVTQTGLSLGTPQYMSPEQATGDRVIDGRSDIYSLAAMLYEMLTGDPPHTASTTQGVIAKVLTDTPRSVRTMRPNVPPHVDAAIAKALEKLPADRWHTAHDFAAAIGRSGDAVALPSGAQTAGALEQEKSRSKIGKRARLWWGLAGLAVGAVVAAAVVSMMPPRASDTLAASFVIEPPMINGKRAHFGDVAVSPDGKTVAFIAYLDSVSQVFLRPLDDVESKPLSVSNEAAWVSYSPDGKSLSITTNSGKLLKTAADGSSPVTIAEGLNQRGPAARANDGSFIIGTWGDRDVGLSRIAASGASRLLTKPDSTVSHGLPVVTADGKNVLFVAWGPGFSEDDYLAIGSLETGEHRRTPLLMSRAMGVVDGNIIYRTHTGTVMAVPFDARRKRLTGDPVRLLDGLAESFGAAESFSPAGTFAFKRGATTDRLVLVDLAGRSTPLSAYDRSFTYGWARPKFSPDGRRVALAALTRRRDTVTSDIWVFDVAARKFDRATSLGDVAGPAWTPDGRRLVFATWWPRKPRLWVQDVDGDGSAKELLAAAEGDYLRYATATPDGRGVVVCHQFDHNSKSELTYVAFSGEPKSEVIAPDVCDFAISPDGKWLAYTAMEDNVSNVFVRPFRAPGGRVRMTRDGANLPVWSRDGNRLYYSGAPDGAAYAARLKRSASGLEVVARDRVAPISSGLYDVAPDGKHILTVQQSDSLVQLVVMTNWIARLRAQLAGAR